MTRKKIALITGLILGLMVIVVSASSIYPSKSPTYAVGTQSAWDDNEVLNIEELNNEEIIVTESSDPQIIREDYANFFNKLNNHIAMTHGIALNEYRQVDIFNLEESEDNLYLTILYLNLPDIDVGDKKPTVFLKNDKEGIVLTQKADGKNVVYYIENDPVDSWKVKNKKVVQGKLMTFEIKKNK